jgi:prolyl 4-hydroxylase
MQIGASPADQAEALAASGRVPEALLLLNRAAGANQPEALFKLAEWRIRGERLPRDLAMARELLGRAAAAGNMNAAVIHANFTANGTGGPSQWAQAMELLRKLAGKNANAKRQLEIVNSMDLSETGDPKSVPEGEVLSESPYVMLFSGAFTAAECKYVIEAAEPLFRPSVVVDEQTGRQIKNPIRTSDGAGFTWPLENPAIHAINRRLAALSGTKADQGEPLQVLRYKAGQEYKPHHDAVAGFDNQRAVTMLIYLNDNYKGGETRFLKTGLSVKGKTGDALLFRNAGTDGRADDMAMHAGMPVKGGVKLIASRWIRQRRFEAPEPGRVA